MRFITLIITALIVLPGSHQIMAQDQNPIDSIAMELLEYSSNFMSQLNDIHIEAEVTLDLLDEGNHKLQFTKQVDMYLQRPQKLYVAVTGDLEQRSFWCDGEKLTILDIQDEIHYASLEVGNSLDETLNDAMDEFDLDLPLADIVFSDVFAGFYAAIQEGHYIDKSKVNGVDCHHLAFYQENLDWQIWIEQGAFPVPRKILLTYKDLPGAPQHAIEFLQFDVSKQLPPHIFNFTPPPGSFEIEFLKAEN